MSNYQQFIGAVQPRPLHRREVKGRQAHDFADPVAQVGVEVEGHASDTCNTSQTAVSGSGHTGRQRAGLPARGRTQVPVTEVGALLRVDLWVGVEVAHPLDVHHDQLVSRPLEGEVTEGLTDNKG